MTPPETRPETRPETAPESGAARRADETGRAAYAGVLRRCATALLVAALALAGPAPAGHAAQEAHGGHTAGTVSKHWSGYRIVGDHLASGGWIGGRHIGPAVVYRTDPEAADVESAYGPVRAVEDFDGAGHGVGRRATQRAAWVLSTYGGVRRRAQAAAVDAVTYDLLVGHRWRTTNARGRDRIQQARQRPYVASYTRVMLRRARHFAGPYDLDLSATPTTVGQSTQVSLRLTSAAGRPMSQVDVVVSYSGHVTRLTTDAHGRAATSFIATSSGEVPVVATAHNLADWRLRLRLPRRAAASRVVEAGHRAEASATATVAVAGAQALSIANTRSTYTTAQSAGGTWTVTGSGGKRTATVGLHGPFTYASDATCDTTPGTTTTQSVDSDATYALPATAVPHVGFYRWSVSVDANATNQAAYACGPAFGVRAVTSITITRPDGGSSVGSPTRGHLVVTGPETSAALTVTWRLYGPFTDPGDATCASAGLFRQRSQTIDGAGSATTVAVKLKDPGWYLWQAGLGASDYSEPSSSACRATRTFIHYTGS